MRRSNKSVRLLLFVWIIGAGIVPAVALDEIVFHHENVMGTALELRVRADDFTAARRAETRVLEEIDRLTTIFSNHDASSEFRRWQAEPKGPVVVSAELFNVLQAADSWRVRSNGAFDPRAEVFTRLWLATAAKNQKPTAAELAQALNELLQDPWRLDPKTRTAERFTDAPLSLDAIAKGYILEQACKVTLVEIQGLNGLLLNVGGDLRAVGETSWTVGLAPARGDSETAKPLAFVEIQNQALATSGNAHRGFTIGDRWYSHVFDPRIGRPVEHVIKATVIAPQSADADALATIFNILPVKESIKLANFLTDVDCLLVTADGRIMTSEGWHQYESPGPSALAIEEAAVKAASFGSDETPWAENFELAIQFEINRPEAAAGRYRRPYVIIYVEDEAGDIVRHLVVWLSLAGSGFDQWLPDVRRWYRSGTNPDPLEKRNTGNILGRPTRPPGEYTVIWDGKDDRKQLLPQGNYTLFLEAAREHGTHQVIRKALTLADKPFAEKLEGGIEIKSAMIEYRRKAPQ